MSDYVEAVARPLRGPRRLRADMLAELADGFDEAVAEGVTSGLDRTEAAGRAAEAFGPARAVAAEFQRELEAAQARRTAWTLLAVLPAMTILWDLFGGEGETGLAVTLLARVIDTATAAAFVTAALVIAGRVGSRAASLCGASGLASIGAALAGSVAIMLIADPAGTPAALPFLAAASAAGSAWVAASSLRALRAARAAA
ncbi:permease prefix domain 1-containing protein [Glycomyces sp. NPDC046736]|uniref:permease prefix domain 1-containing protein n=1 Tax=Glycomyces sp. NPDC046736 TaxID=3155615 RepID=UPI0033C7D20A